MNQLDTHSRYAFTLGREWKISLAELFSLFWAESYRTHSEELALFQIIGYSDEQIQKKFLTIGGSIRVMRVLSETSEKTFPTDVIHELKKREKTGKITFALGAYGTEFRLSDIGLRIKKTLIESGYSARIANIENININAAAFKKEKLSKSLSEYNLLKLEHTNYLAVTLACQDIDAYASRDTGKSRDMHVGMMPPKLVQMMLNLAKEEQKVSIYDPFCGLGTTLIEGANMGILGLYGSDISHDMVKASEKSLEEFIKTEKVWQDRIKAVWGTPNKDFSSLKSGIFQLDATQIAKAFSEHKVPLDIMIVSEGYLGEVMSARDIVLEKVQNERRKLALLYSKFFEWLKNANFSNNIVMTFPFWNIGWSYSYFTEIYDILEKNGFVCISLLPGEMGLNTRKGSLLYRRENQTVGREIIKIQKR